MKPSNVEVASVTTNSVVLNVTASASARPGTKYRVRTTSTTGGSLPNPNPSDPTTDTVLTVTGLGAGHEYSFVVTGNYSGSTGAFPPVNQTTSMYKVYVSLCVLSRVL